MTSRRVCCCLSRVTDAGFYFMLWAMNASIASLQKALENGEDISQAIGWLRRSIDALEGLVDDSAWPLPKYREMLFIY